MLPTRGYAAIAAHAPLQPFLFERRDVGAHDVLLEISHCGICHSDIHMARNEWGESIFPMSAVYVHPFCLPMGALIPIKTDPLQAIDDRLDRFIG